MFNRSAVSGVDQDLRTINFLFKNTSFREVYRNVQDAVANYEIHMALVPAMADLFQDMKVGNSRSTLPYFEHLMSLLSRYILRV